MLFTTAASTTAPGSTTPARLRRRSGRRSMQRSERCLNWKDHIDRQAMNIFSRSAK